MMLLGCEDGGPVKADADHDGWRARVDCDDHDPSANPAHLELCDGVDNDCDGLVDEPTAEDVTLWFEDQDGDGFGVDEAQVLACDRPDGYSAANGDCDDTDASVAPNAVTWYPDNDRDSYGDPNGEPVLLCWPPSGYVWDNSDCDDADPTVHPNADEVCDGVDNDCNGLVDDDAQDSSLYYTDADGDGTGDPATGVFGCDLTTGYATNSWDCDDDDPSEPVFADPVSGSAVGTGTLADPLDSLQDAIDRSLTCVLAQPGAYAETLQLSSSSLEITGMEGSEATFIDPGYAPCSASTLALGSCTTWGTAVTIASASNAAPVLQGFTIRGGTGSVTPYTTSATCADSSSSYGGSATCTVDVYEFHGGGVFVSGDDPVLRDLVIEDNALPEHGKYEVTGGAFYELWVYSFGGGLAVESGSVTLDGVTIQGNFADQGGGVWVGEGGRVEVTHSLVRGNEATDGAGLNLDAADAGFTNAVIAFNTARTDGGGVFQKTGGTLTMTNVVVAGNRSAVSGSVRGDAVYAGVGTTTYAYNSVLTAESSNDVAFHAGTGLATYSDWYNAGMGGTTTGWSLGEGNLNVSPRFEQYLDDGDLDNDLLLLRPSSPCVDQGDPSSSFNDADGSRNDMGAWGGPGSDW